MHFVGSSPLAIWRQRVIGGLSAFLLYVLLYFNGILNLGPLELSAQILGCLGYVFALFTTGPRWLRWTLATWDAVVLGLLIRSNGMTASPFLIMVPVWFFGVALANLIDGDTAPVPWMLTLALLSPLLGGIGGDHYALYAITVVAAVAAMGGGAFTLASERRTGRSDPLLTMLLNRTAGLDKLEEMARAGEAFTLAFVDLAEFKTVNDQHGHKVGDEVLSEIGKRLKAGVKGRDLVARYGGDEFLVALRDVATLQHLRASLEPAVMTSVGPLRVRADIGSVPFERGEDVDVLLERADAAMYARKRSAKLASA